MITRKQPRFPALPNPAFNPAALWNFAYDFDSVSGKFLSYGPDGLTKGNSSFGTGKQVIGTANINRCVLNSSNDAVNIGSGQFSVLVTFKLNDFTGYTALSRWGDPASGNADFILGADTSFYDNIGAVFVVCVGTVVYTCSAAMTWVPGHVYTLIGRRAGTTIAIDCFDHDTVGVFFGSLTNAGITTVNFNASLATTLGETNLNPALNAALSVYAAATFKTSFNNLETIRLLNNPWRLFKARLPLNFPNVPVPASSLTVTPGHIYLTAPSVVVFQSVNLAVLPGIITINYSLPFFVNQIDIPPVIPGAQIADSNLRIISFNEIDGAALTANVSAGSLIAANLQNDIKSRVWRSTGKTAILTAIWNSWKTLGAVVFPFCNFSRNATIRAQLYLNASDTFTALDTGPVLSCPYSSTQSFGWDNSPAGVANFGYGGAVYAAIWFDRTLAKKLVITIDDSANTAAYIEAGRMIAGDYWSPVNNPDYGLQVNFKDASKNSRNDAGDLLTDIMPRAKVISFDFGMIEPADRGEIMKHLRQNGLSRPLFISVFPVDVDSDKTQDYMIYGKLSQLDAIAMPGAMYYSSGLTIEEV